MNLHHLVKLYEPAASHLDSAHGTHYQAYEAYRYDESANSNSLRRNISKIMTEKLAANVFEV